MSEIQIEPGGVSTSSGTGTITGVFASDGLSGGATTGNATLEINHSYQNTFLAPQSITVSGSSLNALYAESTGAYGKAIYGHSQHITGVTGYLYAENGLAAHLVRAGTALTTDEILRLDKYVYATIPTGIGVEIGAYVTTATKTKETGIIRFTVENPADISWASSISLWTYYDDVQYESLKLAAGYANFPASGYLNFGTLSGTSGYGIRDYSGTMQYKNSGGSWTAIGSGGGSSDHSTLTNLDISLSGHLAATTLAKNLFLAGPETGASAAASFRSITSNDLPVIPVEKGGTGAVTAALAALNILPPFDATDEGYALQIDGENIVWGPVSAVPTSHATLSALDFTSSGHLAASTEAINTFLGGPVSGSSGSPSFRAIDADDLPVIPISKGGTSSVTAQSARLSLLPDIASKANMVLAVNAGESDLEWVAQSGGGTNDHTALSNLALASSGHFAATTAAANTFIGAPDSASGVPSFRNIVSNDLPIVPLEKGGTGCINAEAAINNLLPSQYGKNLYTLLSDGYNPYWSSDYLSGTTAQTITGAKTFGYGLFKLLGTSSGSTTINSGLTGASSETYTLPTAIPASDKYMKCNSSGVMSWVDAPSPYWSLYSGTIGVIYNVASNYSVSVGETTPYGLSSLGHLVGNNASGETTRVYGVFGSSYRGAAPAASTPASYAGIGSIATPGASYRYSSSAFNGLNASGGYAATLATYLTDASDVNYAALALFRSGISSHGSSTGIDFYARPSYTIGTSEPDARLNVFSIGTTTSKVRLSMKTSDTTGATAVEITSSDFLLNNRTLSIKGSGGGTSTINSNSVTSGLTYTYSLPASLPSSGNFLTASTVVGSTVTLGWSTVTSPLKDNDKLISSIYGSSTYYYGESTPSGNTIMLIDGNKSLLFGRIPVTGSYYEPKGLNPAKFSVYVNEYTTTADSPINSGFGAGYAVSAVSLFAKELFTDTAICLGAGGVFTSYTSNSTYNSSDSDRRLSVGGVVGNGERGIYGTVARTVRPIYNASFDQYASSTPRGHSSYLDRRAINDANGPTLFIERIVPSYSSTDSTWINSNTVTSTACTNLGTSLDFSAGTGSLALADQYIPHINHGWPHGRMTMYWEYYNSTNKALSGTNPSRPAFGFYLFGTQDPSTANSETAVPIPVMRLSASSPTGTTNGSIDNLKVWAGSAAGSTFCNINTGGICALGSLQYSATSNAMALSAGFRSDYYGASDSRTTGFGSKIGFFSGYTASSTSGYGTDSAVTYVQGYIGTAFTSATPASSSTRMNFELSYAGAAASNALGIEKTSSTSTSLLTNSRTNMALDAMSVGSSAKTTMYGVFVIPTTMSSDDSTYAPVGTMYLNGSYLGIKTASGWKYVLLS